MNAIQILERVYLYMDTTRNARFEYIDYNKAINDAIVKFVDNMFGDEENRNPYSFELTQIIRDNLFTLIKTASPAVTNLSNITTRYSVVGRSRITNPTDYYDLISWQTTIGGVSTYAKPTTYNEVLPLIENSLAYPTNEYPYYVEDSTGIIFYRGTTGTLTVDMTYLKTPATFSCGTNGQLIGPGNNLTIGLNYIATEVSVNNLVTYQPGQLFTAGAIQLVSGQCILASNTTTCDLPEKTHETIAKMAAEILSGTVTDFPRAQFTQKEVDQS